jgi:hypothetical protein
MKKITILLGFVFLFFTSTIAVSAYNSPSDYYLEQEKDIIQVNEMLQLNGEKNLIPLTAVLKQNDTYEIVYQYEVFYQEDYAFDVLVDSLAYSVEGLEEQRLNELFNIDVQVDILDHQLYDDNVLFDDVFASKAIVTISVTMNEPNTVNEYKTLVLGQLYFDVNFSIIK